MDLDMDLVKLLVHNVEISLKMIATALEKNNVSVALQEITNVERQLALLRRMCEESTFDPGNPRA